MTALWAAGVETPVGTGVEIAVEAEPLADSGHLRLQLLGPLAVQRGGQALALPPSRKVRALLAYLALASHEVSRSQACELLWDLPNDPRGELRWCLSKLRGVLDQPSQARVLTSGEGLRLDLRRDEVDALQLVHAVQGGLDTCSPDTLKTLAGHFRGDFLDGLDIPRSAAWSGWLTAQRRRFRATRIAVLERLVLTLPAGSDDALACLDDWLRLAPFDNRGHAQLFDALARTGRLHDGDAHLAATLRHYEAEGQDWTPLGRAWQSAKQRHARPVGLQLTTGPGAADLALSPPSPLLPRAEASQRASLAVMPFADQGRGVAMRGGLGDGLAHDIITRLAKLRSMFVIAQGSVFALDERHVGVEDAARRLAVDYVAGGTLRHGVNGRISVAVQLTETRTARVLWAEEFRGTLDDTFGLLDDIGNRIVSSLASQVELAERNRAILKPPHSLTAWEALHRGLWHMMRFDREDNAQARHFFETAVALDPSFARPYAGLSFTHFQEAFLGWSDREGAMEAAYRTASQGLMADAHDPAARWALGRAQWLRGRLDESLAELATSVDLSPNFAHGHYTLAFVQAQSGDPQAAIAETDHARELSPFDPMLFAMLATRALALIRLGRYDEASEWALKAVARPNAHVHVMNIAMHCLTLARRDADARRLSEAIQRAQPGYSLEDFLAAFRYGAESEALIRRADAEARQRWR